MFRPYYFRWIFFVCLVVGLTAGGLVLYRRASIVTVAVGPAGAPQVAFVQEIEKALRLAHERFRFRIVITGGSADSAALLTAGKADIAVLRSDYEGETNARSVVILQRRTFLAVARKQLPKKANSGAGAKSPDDGAAQGKPKDEDDAAETGILDLLGKVKGVIVQRRRSRDEPTIREILAFFNRGKDAEGLAVRGLNEAKEDFVRGRADLVLFLGNPAEDATRDLINATRRAAGARFMLLGAPVPAGLAQYIRTVENSTITAGVFGGSPPLPSKDLLSVAVTFDVVASARANERRIAGLAKALDGIRNQFTGMDSSEFGIALPSLEETRRFLPHIGTVAQINGESKGILDEYSDAIWLGLFALGGIGSLLSGLMAWLGFGSSTRKIET
ncbi:MAG: hypothetical protein AB7F96_06160 [Beijerinckiaceae bacterium]